VLGLIPASHVRTQPLGYSVNDDLPLSSMMSSVARHQLDNEDEVGGMGSSTDDDANNTSLLASSNCVADVMSSSGLTMKQKVGATAAATGCVFDVTTTFNESNRYFMPSDTCSKAQQPMDSAVKLTSHDWVQFSDHHFAHLQYQQQQQENGSGSTSLTELKPIYFGGGLRGSTWPVSSGGDALSLATADVSGGGRGGGGGSGGGGGYLSVSPGGGGFGLPPSYYGSAYGSYQ